MKKVSWILIAVFFVFLAACQSQQSVSGTADKSENNDKQEDTTDHKDKDQPSEKTSGLPKQDKKEKEEAKKAKPSYEMKDNWYLKPINGEKNKKVILLTIDDAPDKHALEMAKTLKKLNAKAIFFCKWTFSRK
ncbi:hypothetical protein RWE15_20205 [Virgibacillus halophilus]|uniref:NodB homology domain-containing protein n=1 Tax=Tigheibacillus halophilus TaxID=361280 RepID=A0ABU5CA83_9BACI|nr:hypothetical protein [Virgibacillus halophilus]